MLQRGSNADDKNENLRHMQPPRLSSQLWYMRRPQGCCCLACECCQKNTPHVCAPELILCACIHFLMSLPAACLPTEVVTRFSVAFPHSISTVCLRARGNFHMWQMQKAAARIAANEQLQHQGHNSCSWT